jgi:hypothetical protein
MKTKNLNPLGLLKPLARPNRVYWRLFSIGAFFVSFQCAYAIPMNCGSGGTWFATANEKTLVINWNTPFQGQDEIFPDPDPEGTGPITFELSDSIIPTDYFGYIDAYISGLSKGQTVLLERFLVDNDEGLIGPNAILMDSRLITDGLLPLIGEEPNYNETLDYIEVDFEAVTFRDGEIETYFPIRGGLEAIPGEYVYRVSSPLGSFDPKTQRLTIVESPTEQMFTGRVVSNGEPVPGAIVGLLQSVGGSYSHLKTASVADEDGYYTLYAPFEDEFEVAAVAPGYVGPLSIGADSYIEFEEVVERDIELEAGTRTISGSVIDSVTGKPVAGLAVTFVTGSEDGEPDGRFFTYAWTDANGVFSVSVTPGIWGLALKPSEVSSRSYLAGLKKMLLTVDTREEDVTEVSLPLVRGECMVSGYLLSDTLLDESGKGIPLEGVEVFAYNEELNLAASGVTYEDGWFNLAVTPGHWIVFPFSYDLEARAHSGAKSYPIHFSAVDQSIRLDISAKEAQGGIVGFVEDPNSEPVGKLRLLAYNSDSGNQEAVVQTTYGSDGFYSFFLNPGNWFLFPDASQAAQRQLLFKDLPTVHIPADGVFDYSNLDFISMETLPASGRIMVSLSDEQGVGVSGIKMHAMLTQEDGSILDAFGETDSNGQASVPIVDGDWKIHLSLRDLRHAGKQELPLISLSAEGELTELSLTAVDFENLSPRLVAPVFGEDGAIYIQGYGEPGRLYEAQHSRDLEHWTTLGLVSAIEGDFTMIDTDFPSFSETEDDEPRGFYRVTPLQ